MAFRYVNRYSMLFTKHDLEALHCTIRLGSIKRTFTYLNTAITKIPGA